VERLEKAYIFNLFEPDPSMFDDLFDFGKKRTLKQSVGFFIFHSTLVLGFMALLTVFGVA
jgi:hypothetical protein